ncbi:hypothetical protein EUGRSUZ_E03203 [Eucalyptus grandis]|uniref:AAA+ ATPase domain-containing protein n=3 Tax=Eucalyptus grandis TaxID=71139 RepID=A0A059C996_EUCGR|nr:hypothetical protein EUGRSUZ_E03203 [Eucalyptus grandis]KAK3431328.1 hypothetical protein EUGRSUZ_E03203 [Eucalyptus grandis]
MQLRESPSKDEKLKQVIPSSSSPSERPDLRLEMSARAKKIRERLEAIAAQERDLGLRKCAEVGRVQRRERLDSFVYDEEIIGREDAKSAIMNFLLDSDTDEQISFFIIRGQSGIGKTALARCLYEDDMVKKHFDLRMWVCVGYGLHDLESELRKIRGRGELQKIRGRETTERVDDMEQLRKYLLVVEDLSYLAPEKWGRLRILLMGGAQGSKILITSLKYPAVDFPITTAFYRLEALPIELSFDLFMRMACQEEEETRNPTKVAIGRRIVKICDGIPLYIRMIGSLLFFKKTEDEWSNFEDEILELSAACGNINPILELSYSHLPCQLKRCFAFCSLFPDDWVIDKQMLTSLWMAEGFILPIDNGDWDMEDIAHDYFMDLLRRNLFQDCVKDELGNVTSCRMHDIVRGIACSVARTEYGRIDQLRPYFDERTRHLSGNSVLDLLYIPRAYPLRTFIKTSQRKSLRSATLTVEEILDKLIISFKFLRALDLHDSSIEKLPSSICELKHLTFLDLSENEGIVRLPDSVTRLETLQVLKLNKCNKLVELPEDFRKLVNLRQLQIRDCSALSHMPQGLGQLTLLHTLTDFLLAGDDSCSKNCGGLGELNSLSNLRGSLRIEVKGEIADAVAKSNAANLKKKHSLVSLVLVFAGKESDEVLIEQLQPSLNLQRLEIRGYGGAWFPSWISCMPKLVDLRLLHCAACKSLPPLGGLTSLMRLEIGALPIVKCTKSDLHALSSLPNLSAPRIWECPNLKWIPPLLDLKELESLQTSFATIEQVIRIDDRVKEVIKLLAIEDDGVKPRMVGIHGTNGIGKTTIAKAIYNRLSSCFDCCSFLAEIGEKAQINGGIQFLQTKLIRDILNRDGDVASFEGGITFFLDVFSNIKALIVLDDVEELSHLDDLVGTQLEWFGPGSRIIVTSENLEILETYVSPERANIYEVNKMDNGQALELFHKHASTHRYPEIGKRIVEATGQVPFVIEVMGSFLRGKTMEDWRTMEDLIKPHSQEILKDCREISKICYEALDDKQKQIFRDIAWFANGVDSQIASYMWPDLDLLPSYQVLMPLAKIGEDNKLWMHKLLKHLCRDVDQEETKLSGQYMHVTDLEGINGKEGMGDVEALCFDLKNHPHTFTETNLKSMPRVRFLKLDHASMTGNFANVFPKLRWLRWQGCLTDFVATEFSLTELVILDLSWSKVTEDWGCWKLIKMEQLKVLNLTGCTDLLISPTFSSFPNLEILILERCSQLVHLDPSVGGLKKLLRLNLKSCIELNRLPEELGALKALKELLIDETSVRIIPLGSDSKELETLSASNCVSLSLPNGVGELVKLRRLSLRNCHWIRKLPESIGQSPLEELDISGTGIFELPDSFGNLRRLRVLKMDHCFISKFPSFIWHLHSIEELRASSCMNIEGEIPGDIRNLKNLRILRLRNSSISSLPSEIEHLPKLETLDVLHCDMLHELPALPSSLVIVHLCPELKEKVSHIWDKHCFITV